MRFTAEDIRRQLESAPGMNIAQPADLGMQNLLSSMATAAQNSLLEGCPVFIERLRSNPKLAQRLKEIMQDWSRGEEYLRKPGTPLGVWTQKCRPSSFI